MRTILVGYDQTDPSMRALDRAASLAGAFDARLIVTSIVPGTVRAVRNAIPTDPAATPVDTEELAHAREYLDARGVKAGYVAARGDAAAMITMVAEQHDADLIVLGTREFGPADRVMRPSVSQAVARQAHRDVLIVHPD
jgi:nucleotide-binding universal stress UspA family protein